MKLKQPPKEGEIQVCRGFAFFPTKIDVNTTVWLERYERTKIRLHSGKGKHWLLLDEKNGRIFNPWNGKGEWEPRYLHQYIPQSSIPILPNPVLPIPVLQSALLSALEDTKALPAAPHGRQAFLEKEMK